MLHSDDRAGRSQGSVPATTSAGAASVPPPPPLVSAVPPAPPPPPPPVASASWAPPTAAPAVVQHRERPVGLRGRALVAQIAVGLNLAATLWLVYAVWEDRRFAVAYRDGAEWSVVELDRLDALATTANLSYAVTFLCCIVSFIVWFHRAYKNVASWQRVEHGTGWAIGAWFVPFLNIWRPAKIAEEIMYGSQSPPGKRAARWLWPWWGLFLLSGFIDRVLLRTEPDTIERAITFDNVVIVSSALWFASGVLLLAIIRQVTRDQHHRMSS